MNINVISRKYGWHGISYNANKDFARFEAGLKVGHVSVHMSVCLTLQTKVSWCGGIKFGVDMHGAHDIY